MSAARPRARDAGHVGVLHFIVAGPLDQRTGGYLYDARMVEGLRARGWTVAVHELDGHFPDGDEVAAASLDSALATVPDGSRVVVDNIAMGGLPEPIATHGSRLSLLSLVHHPLADETGLTREEEARFTASERAALAPCAGVLVTSGYTAHRLAAFGVPSDRIRVIVPGTEAAPPARGPENGEPPLLLCVATVTPRKGHDVLVDALDQVRSFPWTCVCAGSLDRDEAWAASVREQVRARGLDERITFVGEHDTTSLERFYRGASALVLASKYEGYGMALAESLARGLPVVSTTGGAIPFTVPAEAGVLVPPDDPAAFAGALRVVLDPERRRTLAEAALAHGRALPDWEASMDAFALAIRELT